MPLNSYILLFMVIITSSFAFFVPFALVLRKRSISVIRLSSYLFCFWSFFLIIFATIILFQLPMSFNPEEYIVNIEPLRWLQEGGITQRLYSEIRPNIMIFVPFGFLLPASFTKLRKLHLTALVVFLLTFSIEFFQYFIGRSSDIDDLIANLLGGLIGYGIFRFFSFAFKNRKIWALFIGNYCK